MKEIISVSQYLDNLNASLKNQGARIVGEVSGLQEYPERSYLYFSLKDSKDQSTVKCFMWKRDFRLSGVSLADGLEVIITAFPNVYKPNGGLTMQVEMIELVGEGALQVAYEKLKKKLESEGLFSELRKKALPSFPHRVGIITSKSGAVINDFLSNIGKYGYEILFVDSKVEGQDAIKDLLEAIEILSKKDLDVLVIMRGGGSLESFQAFNNEVLVRAVSDFPAPVLTGIGHDKDAPLVSMVSDKNVSTPTAVANLLNSTWVDAIATVNLSEQKLISNFSSLLEIFKRAEQTITGSLARIESAISRAGEILVQHKKELFKEFEQLITGASDFIKQCEQLIEQGDPRKQLSKGYSIVRRNGKIIRYVKDVKKGDALDVSVTDGIIKTITQ